ncbi:MAG: sigma-70 family RNA polymerase sigma factor [Deltaproteobacteria bacterium]|nr:sigma-70 family RNA polymerase sigma factor [Deltaproteobacteria bacterium]
MTDSSTQPNLSLVRGAPSAEDFSGMYQRDYPYVWKTLVRLGIPTKDRQDVAHDVFVAAFRSWGQFDPSRPTRPWLFGISYRVALDRNRLHSHRFEETVDELDAVDPSRSAEETAIHRQALRQAQQALASLDLERRGVLVLHDIDGVPMPQIAEVMGIPLNTAYSRLRLARRDLNAAVAALQQGAFR